MARHAGTRIASTPRVNVPFCVGLVLLCLTLLSTHLTGGLFARYSTTVSGSDSARVASFQIDYDALHNGSSLTKNFVAAVAPGESTDYLMRISNDSEVTVSCTPSAVCASGNIDLTSTFDKDVVTLQPGEDCEYLLNIAWVVTNGNTPAASMAFEVEVVEVAVNVEQVD